MWQLWGKFSVIVQYLKVGSRNCFYNTLQCSKKVVLPHRCFALRSSNRKKTLRSTSITEEFFLINVIALIICLILLLLCRWHLYHLEDSLKRGRHFFHQYNEPAKIVWSFLRLLYPEKCISLLILVSYNNSAIRESFPAISFIYLRSTPATWCLQEHWCSLIEISRSYNESKTVFVTTNAKVCLFYFN